MASKILERHVQLGKEIDFLTGERFFLANQFNIKKCEYMCTRCFNCQQTPRECKHVNQRFHPRSKSDAKLHERLIYLKRKALSSADPFPSQFRCYLEEVLLHRAPTLGDEALNVYYGPRSKFTDADFSHLVLSDSPFLTPTDKKIIMDYATKYIIWMEKTIHLCKGVKKRWLTPMIKELERTRKITLNV